MLMIRPADKNDGESILSILKNEVLDLYYPAIKIEDFWVCEKDGHIAGIMQLTEYDNFLFLGSLGVLPKDQNQGIAKALVSKALSTTNKDIFLYTVIPDFFKTFGFTIIKDSTGLPSKDRYICEDCFLDKCVTMVNKHAHT